MQKVREESQKLKELYQSSSNAFEKWPQSDVISSCNDTEFMGLLQNLTETDLEAAIYGLQRQLEIEVQLVKCLEHLQEINSESCDITSKLIASQVRVARLRSRLLRCVNKQLNNHGNEGALPPWHGIIMSNDSKQQLEQLSSSMGHQSNCCLTDTGTCTREQPSIASENLSESKATEKEVKRSESELSQICESNSLNWVEAKELDSINALEKKQEDQIDIELQKAEEETQDTENIDSAVKVHKVRESVGVDEGMKKLQDMLEKNLHERGHENKPSGPVKIPPPKPAPYSALEQMPMLDKVPVTNSTDELMATGVDDSDGIVITEQILMQDWDPTKLLEDLFGEHSKEKEEQSQTPTEASAALSIVRMSGFMEKLPSSYKQKKSSVFKGWKKRHFKAFDGKLFYFEDHRNNEPLGMVELKGSSVAISSGKVLEINDSEGKPVLKLRCASQAEAEDWKHAIETEAKLRQDAVYEEVYSAVEGSVIIIDLGSSTVKAGFAKEEAWPQVIFPCVSSVLKEDESDCVYGYGALDPKRRIKSKIRFPLRRSLKIDKLKFSPMDLTGILEHAFHLLKVDPSKHKVVMTIPQNTCQNDKGALVEILLGFFNVEACYLQEQAILAMYSYSAVSGVIVDVGDHTDVIPVVEGCVIEAGASRLPYGGRQVTDMLARLLTEKGHRFFSEVESYITRYIKEQCCYVSDKEICNEEEMPNYSTDIMLDKYKIPDGTRKVTVDTARYRCAEGLFEPIVWGKDHPGISDLVYKAIMSCSMDVRKHMARSIYLSGGGSMLPGFAERLHTEVCAKLPPHSIVQVHAGTDRQHAAFIGASVVARLPLFEELCITQEEWNETGTDALEKWQSL